MSIADTGLKVVPLPRGPHLATAHPRTSDEDEARASMVRAIASSPVHIQWLRDHVAKIMLREADQLARLGDDEGADHLRRRAGAHRAGDTPLW